MVFAEDRKSPFANKEGFVAKDMYFESVGKAQDLSQVCLTGAISYEGEDVELSYVMEKIMDDVDFYAESGGGVTLSGGEVLGQIQGAKELLKACKDAGIATAAETTCYTSRENFEEFLENLDILLCDIKHYDREIHEKIIGGNIDLIHQNIRLACKKNDLQVIGRIPVIPGFNFSVDHAHKFVDLIKDLGIKDVNLLPFHNLGENKYRLMRKDYAYKDMKNLDKNTKAWKDFEKVFVHAGLIKE